MQIYRKTTQQMMADTRDKLILDLRKDREFRLGTIPGAVHIYWEDLQNQMQEHGWEAYSIEDGYRGFYRWQITQE